MALNKHQKLARGIKTVLQNLDAFHSKVAKQFKVLQLFFYEKHLIAGRPLMTERAVAAMIKTHCLGLSRFSPNKELREAANSAPLIGATLPQTLYLKSQVFYCTNAKHDTLWFVPWEVKTVLPSENLKKLEESKLEDILYCASKDEMSEWIDWFEKENDASSLTNQLLAINQFHQKRALFEKNLQQPCFSLYKQVILDFYGKINGPKVLKTLLKIEFAPNEKDSIYEAYQLVAKTIKGRKKRHFREFQQTWKIRLQESMFENLDWPHQKRNSFLRKYFPEKKFFCNEKADSRWKTGEVLDRQTYGRFIYYFANRFIENPLENLVDGEIALLLWIMIYGARDFKKAVPIKKLLGLTTKNVSDRLIAIDGEEAEISCGLANLIIEYTGESRLLRQQKLFPNLTIDKLEDRFRHASKDILPSWAAPALPEAFLIFPHWETGYRMTAKERQWQRQTSPQIIRNPISRRNLQRQLIEASKRNPS